jgi:hypothetical protein
MDNKTIITIVLILALLVIAGLLRYKKSGEAEFSIMNWLKFRLSGSNQRDKSDKASESSIKFQAAEYSTNIVAPQIEHLEIHNAPSPDVFQTSINNLTDKQKNALRDLSRLGQDWREQFYIIWHDAVEMSDILDYNGNPPQISKGDIRALERERLIICKFISDNKAHVTISRKTYIAASSISTNAKLKISASERSKDKSPHIEVAVINEGEKTIFCKAKCHAVYNSSGNNIKRDISDYANYFSWSGGSERGVKEISAGLDGTINLVRTNYNGYGMSFMFDENPKSYWKDEGVYKIDLEVAGTIEDGATKTEFTGKRVMIEFQYNKNEVQDSYGQVFNNGELKLLDFKLKG